MMMIVMMGSAFAAEPKWEFNLSTNNISGIEKSLENIGAESLSSIGLETGYSIQPWFSVVAGWGYGRIISNYGGNTAWASLFH